MVDCPSNGVYRQQIAKFEIKDYEVASVIIRALLGNQYDVVSAPIRDASPIIVGEQITVYKKGVR